MSAQIILCPIDAKPAAAIPLGSDLDWNRNCAAVIPCFNEGAWIGRVVRDVRRYLSRVIVVDDGSTDGTAEAAGDAGAETIRLSRNSGKGAALRRGWQQAQEGGFSWVVMLDGDGQHAADDLPGFFARAERTGATLIVGNRMEHSESMPRLRRWTNRWMSKQLSQLTGTPLPDSQCGFRLAHLETLLATPVAVNRFEIESAMLAAFLAAGEKVEFVPVQTIYKRRASKINPLTDAWRWLRWLRAQSKVRSAVSSRTNVRTDFPARKAPAPL